MRVLVTGASGLLGLNLCLMKAQDHAVIGVVNQSHLSKVPFELMRADLSIEGAVSDVFSRARPDIVFNCAAMAQVDLCERMPVHATRINAWMPGEAAAFCEQNRIPFVHISTDAVFDGAVGGYRETDRPNPLSVYARTKLEGEKSVFSSHPNALVARVNFFGHSATGTRSLAEFFLNHLIDSKPIKGFTDVLFSPIYVKHLIDILFCMIDKKLSGLYHVVANEKVSKYDFGCRIAEKMSLNKKLLSPISVKDAKLEAQRSPNLFLDTAKLRDSGVQIPSIEQGLNAFIEDYRENWHEKLQGLASRQEDV